MEKYVRPEIEVMSGYIPGEQPESGKIIKLNTNENPYRASEKVYEAIRQTAALGLSRYPDPLGKAVRAAVSEKFKIDPNSVLCGNGSDDLLTILTRTFVGSGELLRLPYPTYILYRSLAEIQGAKSEIVPFNTDWTLPDTFFAVAPKLRLVFLPNPNSPSGTIIPKSRILEIAENLPCPLVVDEAYADFAEEHCIDLVEKCDKIIVCRTLSKSYALAGLRFGYLVAAPKLVEQMLKVKDSYNCDSLAIAAAAVAIGDDGWLMGNRTKILATRTRLTEQMRRLGFDVPTSHANFTWNTRKDIALKPVYEFLKNSGILVRYMNYPDWGEGLRISVGTEEQINQCLHFIEQFLLNKFYENRNN
ncbi:MAG: histidinol-phosphate transaminase [Planctomycetaceae bacterium]|nr:histidinol-phosphate transaminase [Planctomycetaceae bacterium]